MNRFGTILSVMAMAATTTTAPPAPGAAPVPSSLPAARKDNVWNGYDHEVPRATTRALEQRQGVYPASQQRARQLATERKLNQQLLGTPAASPPPR